MWSDLMFIIGKISVVPTEEPAGILQSSFRISEGWTSACLRRLPRIVAILPTKMEGFR